MLALLVAQQLPIVQVEAPAEMQPAAISIRQVDPGAIAEVMALVSPGEAPPVVHVVLASERSPLAAQVPPWVAGFAHGATDTIVVFPQRVPSYPVGTMDGLFLHELAHLLAHRAARGRPLPRWFNEGLATVAGRGWHIEDSARLSLAMVGGLSSLDEVDAAFDGPAVRARGAYVVSAAMVREVIRRHGADAPAAIIARVGAGDPFPAAYRAVTGEGIRTAEERFWRRMRVWRWVPIVTSSSALWIVITALALLAIAVRRRRSARIRERWEEEERARERAEEPDPLN